MKYGSIIPKLYLLHCSVCNFQVHGGLKGSEVAGFLAVSLQSCGMQEKMKFALFSIEQEKGTCNISMSLKQNDLPSQVAETQEVPTVNI